MSEGGTEGSKCHRCESEETDRNPLIEVKIPLTGESWLVCDPCINDMVDWLDTDTDTQQ
jgi:hypothetical protein